MSSTDDEPPVLLEHHDNGVSRITLNRPPLNLLDDETLRALHAAFETVESRPETTAVILTATGPRAFSGGHQLRRSEGDDAKETHLPVGGWGRRITEQIEYSTKPIVCGARGWVVGGPISLVLASDVRIVSETVKFRYVDLRMGMAPAWGVTLARLVHYLGRNRALDMLFDPEDIDAARAEELGMVTRVVPDDQLEAEVWRYAEHLAEGAPLTVRCIKECTRAQYTRTFDDAKALQDDWVVRISASEDSKEGTAAWLDKRPPVFVGR